MKDFKGNDLNIGDKVIFSYATSGYLFEGVVKKFTKWGITIEYEVDKWNRLTGKYDTKEAVTTNLLGASPRLFKLG